MIDDEKALQDIVLTRLMRLNATVAGIVTGLVAGLGLFLATNWLLIKGGPMGPGGYPVVGPHLWLLSNFLIGYRVTFLGSLVGFAWGFVIGFVTGYLVARLYNWIVDLRERRSQDKA